MGNEEWKKRDKEQKTVVGDMRESTEQNREKAKGQVCVETSLTKTDKSTLITSSICLVDFRKFPSTV